MLKFLTLFFSIFILPISSLNILLPLYLYPGDGGSAWDPITSTISAYPQIQWVVVINPNSGPGTTGSSPPDANQAAGIAKLNSLSNVKILGYVLTGHGSRDPAAVTTDVDTYASWGSIKGIYFDEASADPSMYSFYQTAADHARSKISGAYIAFNPGTVTPTQYFDYCDLSVQFEASLSDYNSQAPIGKVPDQYHAKTGLQIYSTPADTDVDSIIQTAAGEGVGAIFFGVDCCYKVWDQGLLKSMAEGVADSGESCTEL